MRAAIASLMAIRRVEFLPVELTIFFMPLLLCAENVGVLTSMQVLEGGLLFFLLFTLGDVINCLADRDLDADYKTRLSAAVNQLGVPFVRFIVIGAAVSSFAISIHLALHAKNVWLFVLVAAGLFLGIQYSIGPFHFKSRGVLHLVCLWLLLYFLPMLFAGLLVDRNPKPELWMLAASYATAEMGVILINTSEDYPEDSTSGVRTTTVALGLQPTLVLAFAMTMLGGLGFVIFWFSLLSANSLSPLNVAIAGSVAAAVAYANYGVGKLAYAINRLPQELAIVEVKRRGKLVPVWAGAIGATGLAASLIYFLNGVG